ncbi:MAG TPA: type II toxin-antitoxin system prevent-host-death family antitoxin [Conexibacter sp.]|nr:type II toxin-antitoxin system prevent-host-death family antitoxin [Conexibacter sp.]
MRDGGDAVDRAARSDEATTARGRKPVAELATVPPALTAPTLLARWRSLPYLDPARLRSDLDELLPADGLDVVEVEPPR